MERLRKELERYNRDKDQLRHVKSCLLLLEDEYKALQWKNEITVQRYGHLTADKEKIYADFQASIYAVQQKSGFKNIVLEKKLSSMSDVLEQKDAQLNEVLAQAQLDPSVLGQVKGRLEDVMETKNDTLRQLDMENTRIENIHKQLISMTRQKFIDYGIPKEELGFIPQIDCI